jgi:thioester reductase-like protein
MIHGRRGVLLTGATGLLGRFLLRDLLQADYRVAVLVRGAGDAQAAERIGAIVDFWSAELGRRLPQPIVVGGDIRQERLGLSAADRRWLAVSCDAVVHAAASLSFRRMADHEPFATNVAGTLRLLDLCRRLRVGEFHYVSSAFVCGEADGLVCENTLERGQRFHNPYEESKYEAEKLVQRAAELRSTIYRPSVIIGDSRTGYTSNYHGIYRFIEFAARLAVHAATTDPTSRSRRRLDLRLPFTGDEPRNLVPVDWVSQAIVQLLSRPECHGRAYHLVAAQPTPARLIKEVAVDLLNLEGVRFAGQEAIADPSSLERLFFDHLDEYEPYHRGDPEFDARNLRAALPDLPAPTVDRALLTRLIQFAIADRWGRVRRGRPGLEASTSGFDCREYVEENFPNAAGQSSLARTIALEVVVGLDVSGPTGGEWTLSWSKGELASVCRGHTQEPDVCYRFTAATFEQIVRGKLSPTDAFFAKQIEVNGDVEKALKLAVLFQHFLLETGPAPNAGKEECDALPRLD